MCRETALHVASKQECPETAQALIAAGADLDCKNKDGYGRARRNPPLFHERARPTEHSARVGVVFH